ncbi:MarR family transcriptional regulator [Fulvivirga sp. M361]|uniref:MarR family winged helix-turn-helix transcriptional regulator n=1 Tax=Fulvivirga sp. M361 TaxID=2594266 RepID=UPI00117A3FB7|nr:MarR family transcriptional regulator [Fulvivirga sp. M361]TRX60842.1 MarR family transcriptional regulator [Fulvivirga sp. M361]
MISSNIVHEIRAFNRFYTNVIAVLDQDVLKSNFSLAEARVLFEIERLQPCSARKIMEVIIIDEGYLSRIVKKLVAKNYITKIRSDHDKRLYLLKLSASGVRQMRRLDELANQATFGLIERLTADQTKTLLENMQHIQNLLNFKT